MRAWSRVHSPSWARQPRARTPSETGWVPSSTTRWSDQRIWIGTGPGRVPLQIRWSNHLAVLDGSQPVSAGLRARGCLSQADQWTVLHARKMGTYVLTSDFDLIPSSTHRGGVCRTPGDD